MNISLDNTPFSKDGMDLAMKSLGALSKSVQAIAAETADFQKMSFEQGSEALEKMLGAGSLDKALEVQSTYIKTAYDSLVAQSNRMGELYVELAKDMYKPLESVMGKLPQMPQMPQMPFSR